MIYRYPRYGELYDAFRKSAGQIPKCAGGISAFQDLRDLQVLSQLAWFDEEFQEHDDEVKALIAKGRDYSLEDQALMASKEREILGQVVPVYSEFAARGQIEISTTPFYHPILPLICDSDIASVSHPGVTLPSRFQYPQDALDQLKKARAFTERVFGKAPVGLWPSEGSVSDQALSLAAEAGFQWAASDNGVLARTIHQEGGAGGDVSIVLVAAKRPRAAHDLPRSFLQRSSRFRVFKNGCGQEAAGHFLDRIRENTRPMLERGSDVLVPIILDGENAWEYYDHNGRPFLRELYQRISESSDLVALTVSEALALDPPRHAGPHPSGIVDRREIRHLDRRRGRQHRLGISAARAAEIRRAGVHGFRSAAQFGLRRAPDCGRQRLVLVVWTGASSRRTASSLTNCTASIW